MALMEPLLRVQKLPASARPPCARDAHRHMSEEEKRIVSLSILGVDVAETFSPERVAGVAAKIGLIAGVRVRLRDAQRCLQPGV